MAISLRVAAVWTSAWKHASDNDDRHAGSEDRPGSMSEEQWHTLHQEKIEQKRAFQTLSTNSKVVEVHDAGHSIHLEDPDAVVTAIRDVMDATLHHAQLK